MATNYPTTLDALTNPVSTDATNSATVPHATQHTDANDAIEAIEAELGTLPKGSFGTVKLRLDSLAPLANPTLTSASAGTPGLIVKGAVSQGNFQEWQRSDGVILSSINSNGSLTSVVGAQINTIRDLSGYTRVEFNPSGVTTMTVYSNSTSVPAFVVKGEASQSADLQQWQNSSGTVLRSVGANGMTSEGTTAGAPTIASAGTIAPVTQILFVSGTTTINTITAPAPISTNGGSIVIIPTGMFLTGVTGNIALASTSVANKALRMTYDPITTKWYPSY